MAEAKMTTTIDADAIKALVEQVNINNQQINMLLQLHAQCATCVADVRQGARPAPNLLNVIVDGTGYCHEHVDVVNGRLVPKTGSGLILGGR